MSSYHTDRGCQNPDFLQSSRHASWPVEDFETYLLVIDLFVLTGKT